MVAFLNLDIQELSRQLLKFSPLPINHIGSFVAGIVSNVPHLAPVLILLEIQNFKIPINTVPYNNLPMNDLLDLCKLTIQLTKGATLGYEGACFKSMGLIPVISSL